MNDRSISVLVVDDSKTMCGILRALLGGLGIRNVTEARDVATAFEFLRDRPIDLAIVDYELGDLNGVEFTRLIRTAPDSPNPRLPILMVTAHSDRRRAVEAVEAGVQSFMVKPLSAQTLARHLNAVLNGFKPSLSDEPPLDRRRA